MTLRRVWERVMPTSPYRRHAMISTVASLALYSSGLVTGPILARVLGPRGRGDVAAVVAPATVLSWLLALGIPTAAAYFLGTASEEKLLLTASAFGVVVGVPLCAALWLLAPRYLAGHSSTALTWARVVLVVTPFTVGMSAALEIRRRVKPGLSWNCWRSAPIVVPAIGVVVLAAVGNLTLQAVLALNVLGAMLPLGLLLIRLYRLRPDRSDGPSFAVFRLMLPYAWRTASMGTAVTLTNRLDQVVLVAVVPPAQLGLYVVAVTVASLTNPLTSGLTAALFGHLRGEQSVERAAARFRRSLVIALALSATVALVLALFAPLLLRVVFGRRFEPAAPTLRLLLPGSVSFDVLGVMTAKLLSEGRPGEASWAALVGAIITVVGLLALTPHFGINGAAVVTSAAWTGEVVFLVARGALETASSRAGPDAAGAGAAPVGRV